MFGMLTKETKDFKFPYLYINRGFVIRKNAVPEEKKISLRLQHSWMKAAQQHSRNLLFGFFFSLVFFVRERHDVLLVFRSFMMDRFCLKILIFFFLFFFLLKQTPVVTRNLSRPTIFFSIPLRVLVSSLRFFPCFQRITVYSDEI